MLGVGTFLAGIGPALPRLAELVGRDVAALGSLFTAFSAGVIFAQAGTGAANQRFGLRNVLAASLALTGSMIIAVSFSGSLLLLLICALLGGIGFGGILAAANLLVARLFPLRSTAAINGFNIFFGVGAMLGPVIASMAGARLDAPQAALWVGGGLLLLLAPFMWRLGADPPLPRPVRDANGAPRPTGLAAAGLLGVLLMVYTGTEIGFGGWVTVYMLETTTLDPAAAALVAASLWLALTAGRALGVLLGLRFSPPALLLGCLTTALGGAFLLLVSIGDVGRSVAGAMLLGIAFGPVFPTIMALVAEKTGGGAGMGLALAIGNGGGLFLPALLGILLSQSGPPAMIGAVVTATAIMLVLCLSVVATVAPLRPRAVSSV